MRENHVDLIKHRDENSIKKDFFIMIKSQIKLKTRVKMIEHGLNILTHELFSKESYLPSFKYLREIMEQKIYHELIPTGFIYVQPHQSSPALLWPWAKWEEVTSNYSGHFFRAEGNGSAPFGIAQEDAIRQHQHHDVIRISKFSGEAVYLNGVSQFDRFISKETTGNIASIDEKFISPTETRPKNYAVKIWMRLG